MDKWKQGQGNGKMDRKTSIKNGGIATKLYIIRVQLYATRDEDRKNGEGFSLAYCL